MYRLRNLKNGLFQIHSTKYRTAFEGTPETLFHKAQAMGIPESELSKAVNEMLARGDDYADFGIYGHFIWSKRNSNEGGPHGHGWQ